MAPHLAQEVLRGWRQVVRTPYRAVVRLTGQPGNIFCGGTALRPPASNIRVLHPDHLSGLPWARRKSFIPLKIP